MSGNKVDQIRYSRFNKYKSRYKIKRFRPIFKSLQYIFSMIFFRKRGIYQDKIGKIGYSG